MQKLDYSYICRMMSNLSGIPVRHYTGEILQEYFSVVSLPKDPICTCLEEVLAVKENVGYFITPDFFYYGILNSGDDKIIIGPTRQIAAEMQELRDLAFQADVSADETENFVSSMMRIVTMPFESLIQMLCTINYVLNGEKLNLEDVTIYDTQQESFQREMFERIQTTESASYDASNEAVHNTLSAENAVMNIVQKGDLASLQQWLSSAPAVRPGITSANQLRQLKNIFIVTATLASRAAIRGGLDANKALSLSDAYIQKNELLQDVEQITNLQYLMIRDYTERVSRIRVGPQTSKLAVQVANYVQQHMSESIKAEDIAKHLFLSRPYLSAKFAEDTGMSLTDFILKEKTEEAKRLLRYTDKPLSAIAAHLGFSSQSHFSKVFKKYASCSPGEYRQG